MLRKEALEALAGSELTVHAGYVGRADILSALDEIAPVIAGAAMWIKERSRRRFQNPLLPKPAISGSLFCHIIADLNFDAAHKGFGAIVFRHSHKPHTENPEAAPGFSIA